MRLRMREDASIAMRLVRRIDALKRNAPPPSPSAPALPKLAPIAPPPMPSAPGPLYHAPDPTAPVEARSEYYWEKHLRRLDGSIHAWQAQRKAARKQYLQSEKGRAARKQYLQSEKGKAARARYAQSDKGKAARARYAQSDKGKAALRRAQAAYRARKSTA
jgi:DNA-binding PadR family transcriptional regulator